MSHKFLMPKGGICMTEQTIHPFIASLQELADKQERGALAALRRGLGQTPGAAPEMFRYVEPYLPQKRSSAKEAAYYLVAALFALHPNSTNKGNMGAHMRACDPEGKNSDALERRFTALLAAHPDDLPDYLRQTISFLRSRDKEIPVNWNQLLWDLQDWDDEDRHVQKRWASAFWGRAQPSEEPSDK
jgi:CRISPR system Cascade subunit CasB